MEKTLTTTFTIWPTDRHPKTGNKTLGSILYLLAKLFHSFLLFSCKMRHQYLALSTPKMIVSQCTHSFKKPPKPGMWWGASVRC